jgi:hypothetical protein
LIDVDDFTLILNPEHPLPTLVAERCNNAHLYYQEPSAFGSIYTVRSPKVWIHFQPPHQEEYVVQFEDDKNQYLTTFAEGKFVTELVIRGK